MGDQQSREQHAIRVVGICGSLREGSYTRIAVEIALEGARRAGAETRLIDLRDFQLVFCDGRDDESTYPKDVFRLRKELQQAQGVILGTPEYHGSLSGVLKNALDLMGADEFRGKMVGLVGVTGGAMGAGNSFNALRTIGRTLHAWVIPEQVSVNSAWKVFDEQGKLKDSNLERRLLALGEQIMRYASLLVAAEAGKS